MAIDCPDFAGKKTERLLPSSYVEIKKKYSTQSSICNSSIEDNQYNQQGRS